MQTRERRFNVDSVSKWKFFARMIMLILERHTPEVIQC
jgi:hypothetical protein